MKTSTSYQSSSLRKPSKSFITPIGLFCLAGIFACAMVCSEAASVSGKTSKLWLTLLFDTSAWSNGSDPNDTVPTQIVHNGYFASLPAIGQNAVCNYYGTNYEVIPYEYKVYANSATTNAQTAANFNAKFYDVSEVGVSGGQTYTSATTNRVFPFSRPAASYRSIGSPISTNGSTYYAFDGPGTPLSAVSNVGTGKTYTNYTLVENLSSTPLFTTNGSTWTPAGTAVTHTFTQSYNSTGWH